MCKVWFANTNHLATSEYKSYYVFLIQCPTKLLYYDIIRLQTTVHSTIAETISDSIIKINSFTEKDLISSICTDNAASLFAATKHDH